MPCDTRAGVAPARTATPDPGARKLAQHERRFQQVEQFDVREVARYAFQPAVDHRGSRVVDSVQPVSSAASTSMRFEQCTHPPPRFAVERDQGDVALAGAKLFGHPGDDGARFGFEMRRRASVMRACSGEAGMRWASMAARSRNGGSSAATPDAGRSLRRRRRPARTA